MPGPRSSRNSECYGRLNIENRVTRCYSGAAAGCMPIHEAFLSANFGWPHLRLSGPVNLLHSGAVPLHDAGRHFLQLSPKPFSLSL